MKEKILAALKLKNKGIGLSDKTLEGIADMLAVTTTEEDAIETAVNGVEPLLKGFQSDADKRVTDAVAKAKKEPPTKPEKKGGENEPETPKTDEEPAWAKKLAERLERIEQGKTIDTRKQTLEEKLKDVNPAFRNKVLKDFARMQFEGEDEFNEYVEETLADAGELSKALVNENLDASGRPLTGNSGNTSAKVIDADIAEWSAKNKPESTKI